MIDVSDAPASTPRAHIQDFLISRELAEVYLLLDNVSSVKVKLLPEVPVGDKLFSADESWIQQVCEIAWPPDGATIRNESRMAAQLIKAKDMLNTAAAPATGASIAFTTLMTGDSSDGRTRPWLHALFGRGPGDGGGDENGDGEADEPPVWPPTRGSLAALAYPNLAHAAWLFRFGRRSMIFFLVLWLIGTCFFSWDVATGSALLNRVGELNQQAIVQGSVAPLEPAPSPASSPSSAPPTVGPTSRGDVAHSAGEPAAGAGAPNAVASAALDTDSTCRAAEPKKHGQCIRAWGNLKHWLRSQIWPRAMFGCLLGADAQPRVSLWRCLVGGNAAPVATTDGQADGDLVNLEWAAVFIGILAGTILPIAYGVLGAAAAVVRGISIKMRDYTLMPRDIILAGIQLALGAVIGACIGLFVSSDAGTASQGGLIGSVHLTQSALCFVAGFGVEGVFQALEALVRRVFNLEQDKAAATPSRGAT